MTGTDLVRAQLRVASGEPLPWTQADLAERGHAIEARIYAEDPANLFMPQAGPLLLYREPTLPGVRVDSGVAEGGEVPVHYDPLIAKVIATDETRDRGIARLVAALRAYPILGIRTNTSFLIRVLEHPRFRAGDFHTGFLDEQAASLAEEHAVEAPPFVRAVLENLPAGCEEAARLQPRDWDPWRRLRAWRV